MQLLRGKRARLVAVMPPNSSVLNSSSCWSDAKWDETPSKYATQIWNLPRHDKSSRPNPFSAVSAGNDVNIPLRIQHKLGKWDTRQYDFDSSVDDPPLPLKCYRAKQQDVCQYSHDWPWLPQMEVSPSGKSLWAPVLSSSRNLDLLFRYDSLPLPEDR